MKRHVLARLQHILYTFVLFSKAYIRNFFSEIMYFYSEVGVSLI